MKYDSSDKEEKILPNRLGLKTKDEINKEEFNGFLKAEIIFTEQLTPTTPFTLEYIYKLHEEALSHLYSFAGKLRTVNVSKGGFVFPAAIHLKNSMESFENELLKPLPNQYQTKEDLIQDIAKIHAELLFIHPFREGNGRTARILANLMARKQGYPGLNFGKITSEHFNEYVAAVQDAASMDYSKMEKLITSVFPNQPQSF